MHQGKFPMSILLYLLFLSIFVSTVFALESKKIRESFFLNGKCRLSEYKCQNGQGCISRNLYCNGINDCGDNSDEQYCNYPNSCSNIPGYVNCGGNPYGRRKCIPEVWQCDGIQDCPYNTDEVKCVISSNSLPTANRISMAHHNAMKWILSNRNNQSLTARWGSNVPRIAIALYLNNPYYVTKGNYTNEIAYELTISLLSRLALKKIEDIPTSELAIYVNAFLLSCINPRKFYVLDLVKELRKRVDKSNSTNPAALLALCNAEETMTDSDIVKMTNLFWESSADFHTDTQALIIMALACALKQNMIDQEDLSEMTMEIKKRQYRNGTVENIKTTALVMQALFASEAEADENNFDESKALQQILTFQKKDGSFGNFLSTYYVIPVLNYLSFVNISSTHCTFVSNNEIDGLLYLRNQVGEKWSVKYSLWIGEDKVFKRSIAVSVPVNTSFYGVMEYASDLDEHYKFEYSVRNRKPYIFALSGIMDDAEMGTFWRLYFFSNDSAGGMREIKTSVADVYPKHNDHLVFWYKNYI